MAEEVACSAGCKRTAALPEDGTSPPGWEQLPISGRWRCPHCYRELIAARGHIGNDSNPGTDTLPPGSIGALKKLPETITLHEKVKP